MIVTLFEKDRIISVTLPQKVVGRYWINDDIDGEVCHVLAIEAIDGAWAAVNTRSIQVLDEDGKAEKYTKLEPLSFHTAIVTGRKEPYLLFTEPVTADRQMFQKYRLSTNTVITIGRAQDNVISYENEFVSGHHCRLFFQNGYWVVEDLDSANGVYVNQNLLDKASLLPGDIVFIMGLKLVLGKDFVAMNAPDSKVSVDSKVLPPYEQPPAVKDGEEDADTAREYFCRSPRFKDVIRTVQFRVESPPAAQKAEEMPLALSLGPSITMGMASMCVIIFSLISVSANNTSLLSVMPTLAMSGCMMLGMIMWPIITKRYQKKKRIKQEKIRQEKYREYLEDIRRQIAEEGRKQKMLLEENTPTVNECIRWVEEENRSLWERVIGQEDFLELRLGIGNTALDAAFSFPEKRFSLEDDILQEEVFSLAKAKKELRDVPVFLSLTEYPIWGIIGKRAEVVQFVKGLMIQIAALHSYDEVKFVLLAADGEYRREWSFVKWLPHTWNDEKTMRFVAADAAAVKDVSMFLECELESRNAVNGGSYAEYKPYYVVVAADKKMADKADCVAKILQQKVNKGFSLLALYDELGNLPKECGAVVEVNGKASSVIYPNAPKSRSFLFSAEHFQAEKIMETAAHLANIQLALPHQRLALPELVTFLEMYGVGKLEHLNPLNRWRENDPTMSLRAPVGIGVSGECLMLDLHEKYHGPHGLIAGMTGSGKSEMIITYILSMAVNYHPDEVAFVLIDYKGGGLAGAFEDKDKMLKLPHLAGTITNLDGASVKRSLVSIQSELRHRQKVFNEARKISNEGTMDIYKYQKLRREGVVREAVPHLFIISDEFAELKTQQPEFMEQLISAARIGRSLGVHLILATQKPSGVVDDQIWSNSRFRLCLKVQEKSDSVDMIKRADAAELAVTGRFYLQVGFNEIFEMGQSAWCGAPYYPLEFAEKKKDDSLVVVDRIGRVIREVKPAREQSAHNETKQLVAIVRYLSDLAAEEHIEERQLWQPPIPEHIYIEDISRKYGHKPQKWLLDPVVGEYDDPFNQRQDILTVPFSREGNVLVYGMTGAGKTSFLTTMLYSLVVEHSPEEVNIYILDFGAETLRSFQKMPHVGDVATAEEGEKITNLFKLLNEEVAGRKKLFADWGGDYQEYIKKADVKVPNIVVVVNNYAGFSESCEELRDTLLQLSREGSKYGIYFILTASNANTVLFRLQQNFKQTFVLQMVDKNEYSSIMGHINGVVPSKYKGRGIIRTDAVYEFQTADICQAEYQAEFIARLSEKLTAMTPARARAIPVMPSEVHAKDMAPYLRDLSCVPLGVEKESLNVRCIDLQKPFLSMMTASSVDVLLPTVRGLAVLIGQLDEITLECWDASGVLSAGKNFKVLTAQYEDAVIKLFDEMVLRNNTFADSKNQESAMAGFDERLYIIVGLTDIMQQLSEDVRDKLETLLDKGRAVYRMHIVLADKVDHVGKWQGYSWFKTHLNVSNAVWVGDGFANQYYIKVTKMSNALYAEIGSQFGYVIDQGKSVLVKLLTDTP